MNYSFDCCVRLLLRWTLPLFGRLHVTADEGKPHHAPIFQYLNVAGPQVPDEVTFLSALES
jgi:hypothetical protein